VGRFVLSDAAPLICLAQVDGLPWLKAIFGRVHVTEQVRDEILVDLNKPGEGALAEAIKSRLLRVHPEWKWTDPQFSNLGRGEESCITAAVNLTQRGHECLLIIDDREGRLRASSLSIPITGTAAIIGAAKQRGLIPSAQDVFTVLRQKGFRVSESIVQGILESVGELAETTERQTTGTFPTSPLKLTKQRRKRLPK
jgi:predicted nucleic acid-binding protein